MKKTLSSTVLIGVVSMLAAGCGDSKNPVAPGPPQQQPFTQSMTGTVSIFGTTRHALNIPRSGNLRVTLNWSGDVDLDLYLTNSSCQEPYEEAACDVILASDSFVGTQETIAYSVTSGQTFALFVDSLSTTQAATYTLDIRIE